jgi:hypothetical protein
MRSLILTFVLALLAALVCGIVGWRLTHGNLDVLLGVPPTPMGEYLYPELKSEEVKHIVVQSAGLEAQFERDSKGWTMTKPWRDRMDPRAAANLIDFTRGTRVADVIPREKIDPKQAGFNNAFLITMADGEGRSLCRYLMGRKTAWFGEEPQEPGVDGALQGPKAVETVFIRTLDKNRKSHVYASTGNIRPLFNNGFAYLRDHHPFYFNPTLLEHIRIRSAAGELTLSREAPDRSWQIVKPLALPTDHGQMVKLIQGLYSLRAIKVSDRSAVTMPTNGATSGTEQITLQMFGSKEEVTLEILPLQSPDATTRLATVSDRPNAVFELPVRTDADLIGLSSLPTKVNDLRDATLTNINVAAVKGILIQPAGRPPITLSRDAQWRWVVGEGEEQELANERLLYSMLKAVADPAESKVSGFVTDAATDFSPWGLDNPILTLRFLGMDNQVLELAFGKDAAGNYYVNRQGTTSVMKINGEILGKIATQGYQWRHALMWSFNRMDLRGLQIEKAGSPVISLKYDHGEESWEVRRGGVDAMETFEPPRAKFLLGVLENTHVNRWLPVGDTSATTALLSPALVIKAAVEKFDDDGNSAGLDIRELKIAPVTAGAANRFYFGITNTDPHPFLLDEETVSQLAIPLFDDR